MKHTDHFSDNYVKNCWCPNIYEKNIRNNIIIKTEQNSCQAHHIKRQNQNLEDKHCRFR